MGLVMGISEHRNDRVAERRLQQRAAVFPAALVGSQGLDPELGQFVGKSQSVQDSRRIRADLNSGANLTQGVSLLVDMDIEAGPPERKRGAQTTDAAPNNCDLSI